MALGLLWCPLAGCHHEPAALYGRALSQRPGLAAGRVTDPACLAVWRQCGVPQGYDAAREPSTAHWSRALHLPSHGAGAGDRGRGSVGSAGGLRSRLALAARQKAVECGMVPELAHRPDRAWRDAWHGSVPSLHDPVGRAHAHPAPRRGWHRSLLPAGPHARAWSPEYAARDALVCDCVYRAGAWRPSRLGADDVRAAFTPVFAGELGAAQYT